MKVVVAVMDEFGYLQPILGTDRKNPVFSVYQHSQSKRYHVYYGLELFEVVPCDHEGTRFKLMVAHLRNVGAKFRTLQKAFGVDPRTIKKWSDALKSGDAEKLIQALAGRNAGRKLTPAVEQYVRLRFESIYAEDRYRYSRKIRDELKEFLQVGLSAETLRPLLGELKAQFGGGPLSGAEALSPREPGGESSQECPEQEAAASCESEAWEAKKSESMEGYQGSEKAAYDREDPLGKSAFKGRSAPENRRQHTTFLGPCWSSHLGLLLFSQALLSLERALGGPSFLPVCQWMSQVLLGAINLEQTKLISVGDLGYLLGEGLLGGPDHQRRKLSELAADPDLTRKILCWNFRRLGGAEQSDFFYDPHTKHYTGKQNVLKGWCPKIRWADKVMHGDFVHSRQGQPLYLENSDNYEDMRKRFVRMEERFRESFGIAEGRELTWIIDRGIYSHEIFEWILDSADKHLITWEKGYGRDAWPEGRAAEGSMSVERARNDSNDLRTYHLSGSKSPGPKSPNCAVWWCGQSTPRVSGSRWPSSARTGRVRPGALSGPCLTAGYRKTTSSISTPTSGSIRLPATRARATRN